MNRRWLGRKFLAYAKMWKQKKKNTGLKHAQFSLTGI